MKGTILMGGVLIVAAGMGAGLWYSTQVAHYEPVSDIQVVQVAGQDRPVMNYQGLDGVSSPLKLRACFQVDWPYDANAQSAKDATPLIAPGWFDCFDAEQINADLASGAASAILATVNQPFGFDSYIAQYPDGRAYMWRQINICGERHFAGDAMPVHCPSPDAATQAKRVMIDPNSELFTLKLTSIVDSSLHKMRLDGDPKIAAASTGRDFHACFKTPSSLAFLTENFKLTDTPAPPEPRGNFACFNASQIATDLRNGRALAFIGQRDIIPGYDRIIAVYSDGQAYGWHQKGNAQ